MGEDPRQEVLQVSSAGDGQPRHGTRWRLASSGLVFLMVAGGIVYGGDFFGIRDRIQPVPHLATPLADGASSTGGPPILASTPYWQAVANLLGDGSAASRTVSIAGTALQWRVSWTCQQDGHLTVVAGGSTASPFINSGCPGTGSAVRSSSGNVALTVNATGPWQLKVEQQVDVPVDNAPLAAMTAPGAAVVSSGSFYGIDQEGSGRVTVYRLPDRSYALRLDNFYVTPNAALDLRFSTPAAPHSDSDVADSAVAPIADLVATAGSMNLTVPPGIDPTHFGSVAVWCLQLKTAYSAATLASPR